MEKETKDRYDRMTSEEAKKWSHEWDYWRGYFNAVKKKDTVYILSPENYDNKEEEND